MSRGSRKGRVLVVDDDAAVVDFLVEELEREGFAAHGVTSGQEALDLLGKDSWDVVVSDVEMPGLRGPELMAEILRRQPRQAVILVTAFGSIELAVQTVRAGAVDFLAKPFPIGALLLSIERALRDRTMRREIVRLRRELRDENAGVVAASPGMKAVLDVARRVARSDSSVFLCGESGVGKGALARFVHQASPRSSGPFVQVNCAALPAGLVESELFGVRRGAFTDARENRDGAFVQAAGGTLFLDEIGEMPAEAQASLLQALETRRIRPVGADRDQEVDVRVLAATNRPVDEALRDRRLRADLFFRLAVIRIDVPPLRERREDIPALLEQFLQSACERAGRDIVGVSDEAMRWLLRYDWPGNVRELSNAVERAVILADGEVLGRDDFQESPGSVVAGGRAQPDALGDALASGMSLADVEKAYIRQAVTAAGGNVSRAATMLGIDRRTVYRKLGEGEGRDEGDAD